MAGSGIFRTNHTASIYGDKLFVFGGKDQHEKLPKYTFYCLNLSSINPSEWGILDLNHVGFMPSKRWGHSSTVVNDQMIIYGGHDDKQFLNDLWIYNFGKNMKIIEKAELFFKEIHYGVKLQGQKVQFQLAEEELLWILWMENCLFLVVLWL